MHFCLGAFLMCFALHLDRLRCEAKENFSIIYGAWCLCVVWENICCDRWRERRKVLRSESLTMRVGVHLNYLPQERQVFMPSRRFVCIFHEIFVRENFRDEPSRSYHGKRSQNLWQFIEFVAFGNHKSNKPELRAIFFAPHSTDFTLRWTHFVQIVSFSMRMQYLGHFYALPLRLKAFLMKLKILLSLSLSLACPARQSEAFIAVFYSQYVF